LPLGQPRSRRRRMAARCRRAGADAPLRWRWRAPSGGSPGRPAMATAAVDGQTLAGGGSSQGGQRARLPPGVDRVSVRRSWAAGRDWMSLWRRDATCSGRRSCAAARRAAELVRRRARREAAREWRGLRHGATNDG
jgi:hypothetical protein